MFKEYKRSITVAVIVFVFVIAGLISVSFVYTNFLFKSFKQDADAELSEKAENTVSKLRLHIQKDTEIVEDIGMLIEDTHNIDDNMDYLKQIVSKNKFNSIVVIDSEGTGRSTTGDVYNCANADYFKKGIVGGKGVTEQIYSFNSEMINVYYAPIMHEGSIIGVIAASYDTQEFQNSLDLSVKEGLGRGYIANNKGTLIACSENAQIDPSRNTVLDLTDSEDSADILALQRVVDNMIVGSSGRTQFSSSEGVYYMNFVPLDINGWYLINIIPEEIVTGKIRMMTRYTVGVIGLMLAVFVAIFIYVIHTLRKNSQELYHFAFTDDVTGYGNSNAFARDLKEAFAGRCTRNFAVLHIDIDKFKYINDMYGYDAGDAILKEIAVILDGQVKKEFETHARLSNDMFVVLLTYIERGELVERIDAILNEIEKIHEGGKSRMALSVNIGIYEVTDRSADISMMIDRANLARRSVKNSRFSKIAFYHDNMRDDLLREKEIEAEMHDALASGQFEVYYQPKYFVNTTILGGAEALIRWNHPEKGLIPPNHFIPLFEKNGFVVQLDLFVFEETCKDLMRWKELGYKLVPISVNLSRVHFYEQDFMSEFKRIMAKYNVPSSYIEFEVTETVAFENTEKMLGVLNEIHSIGCAVSMDDFGNGYSSLNMLKQIPVDVLKIDREFFKDSLDNPRGKEIVTSVVSLAKRLGINVVAEGIEEKEQLEFLRDIDCDLAQGYYFAKPLRKADFEARLKEGGV